jgi:hypothetical protein
MLLSAVADAWIRAALKQTEPPVIVAASANNQAVTNIIDAFGENFGEGKGPFAGRWLPDLKSYGAILQAEREKAKSTRRYQDAARRYQTEPFFEQLESHEYVPRAREAFLEAGKTAFPDLENPDVQEIVSSLHKRITEEVAKLSDADKARTWVADCHTRFHLFRLACHYWEGRWLLEMEMNLDEIVASHRKTGRKTVEPRWHRRMMLTPCAVSTFASLPGKMSFGLKSGGEWGTGYLFDFIDLLIVDEAGQVLPEIAAPSFTLAKRALVIGDTQQIEPISSVSKAVDIGNLKSAGFLKETYAEADLATLSSTGIRSVDGSVMRLAQQACPFEPYPDLERGLYLFEHRRCYDEIINFSNKLCYKGSLKPMRGNAPDGRILPSMGYLHIDGMALSYGGSRANVTEAATIADWILENRSLIEGHYQKLDEKYQGAKLEDLVGIVTPFGRQVREIKDACAARGISSKMTIGTVHSLQGAERPIIIFSSVYSKHADGQFIDMSPSMLNVTVSRAQDSFLVFGDMDVFSLAAKGTPRAVLAEILFSPKGSALEFEVKPRPDLQTSDQSFKTLRDAAEHDSFLLDVLSSSAREFTIVSPWVIASTMKRAGLLDAFKNATARGAEINVFVDPLLNEKPTDDDFTQLETAKAALSEAGVRVHEVRQLHSKIVIVDENQLCIGSYNWLSADRKGRYARHETSIAYTGSHLQGEIDVIKGSLGVREKR